MKTLCSKQRFVRVVGMSLFVSGFPVGASVLVDEYGLKMVAAWLQIW